jgi:hypothetical protein
MDWALRNIVNYHRVKILPGDREVLLQELENYLKILGWTHLSWGFGGPTDETEVRRRLRGCPPGYAGQSSDYWEEVAMTLQDKQGNPKDEILVRERLNGVYGADQIDDFIQLR